MKFNKYDKVNSQFKLFMMNDLYFIYVFNLYYWYIMVNCYEIKF